MTGAGTPEPPPDGLRGRRRLRPATVLLALTAAAAGLLFATSARTADGTDLRADRRLGLGELISRERSEVARQERAAAQLRTQVDALGAGAAARDSQVAQEESRADAVASSAGTTAVAGPALRVSLDDAPDGVTSASADDLVVHQQDVQAVVNALWAGGAEAMTLMGERVVSTSAVRCVGNTLVLHGQVYGPPFVVTAIGDRERMRTALSLEPGVELFLRYVDRFRLGYEVTSLDDVAVPAYTGPLDLPSVAPPGS